MLTSEINFSGTGPRTRGENMGKKINLLNQHLKNRRKELGLSQAEVAKELGYSSPQFVSNWERGLVSPPLTSLPRLMLLLNIPRETIIDLILADTRNQLDNHLPTSTAQGASARIG